MRLPRVRMTARGRVAALWRRGMPVSRMQFSLRRMFVAVAIAAGMAASISSMEPTYIYGPRVTDMIMLDVVSPIGPDGRKGTYTVSQWSALIAQMSSAPVLDAALADPRIARLSLFRGVADPQSALAGTFRIRIIFSDAETDSHPAANAVTLDVYSPMAVNDVADALADSIAANGPAGVTVIGRPISVAVLPIGQVPWHRDWRLYAIVTASLVAILVVLVIPWGATGHPTTHRWDRHDKRREETSGEPAESPSCHQPV
jgi:hypothetical protein